MTQDEHDDLAEFENLLLHRYGRPEVIEQGQEIEDLAKRAAFYLDMIDVLEEDRVAKAREREAPVDAMTFFTDPYFMGDTIKLWPKLLEEVCEACSGKYIEAVWTGAIGTGKTTGALATLAYYLYRLMNLRSPHTYFDLDPNSEIAFIMQSVTGSTAFTVDYMRFRRMLENSPWFQRNAPYDHERTATIQFIDPETRRSNAILVQPLPGNAEAAIGENVFGGMIDEVNHMKVVQRSSKKKDGEHYDQMLENYRAVSRRRESRFQRAGAVPGMLCLVGSANYAGQFTDRKKKERDRQIEETGESSIYLFDKRPWEVQPEERFSPGRFRVFLGDGTRKPRVLGDNETASPNDAPFIMNVPVDYKNNFVSDLPGAVKDIAGIALHGFSSFMGNLGAIKEAFGPRKNLFNPDWCDFENQGARILKREVPNPKASRYVHVDLSLSMDYAALSMGYCDGFRAIDRGGGMKDMLPVICMDGMLSVRPTGGGQIPIHKLKKLVLTLRELGYPIEWVSLDGFQSADFIQTMRRNRMRSGVLSLDRTPEPYLTTRTLILDGCLQGCESELAFTEFRDLIWVSQNTKVDHPPDGSKDLADTVAGVAYGLASKKATWIRYGIDPAKSSIIVKKDTTE